MEHLRAIGEPSPFACPECHGGLWKVLDSRLARFRCRTGHAFTEQSLQFALSQGCREAVWNAIRAVQERQILLEQIAAGHEPIGDEVRSAHLALAAGRLAPQVDDLRKLSDQLAEALD